MKFLKADKDKFTFQIDADETQLLFKVLELYPLIPASHHRLTRSGERPDDQHMLEEALAAHRLKHRDQLLKWKKAQAGLAQESSNGLLTLKPAELEWLLQVLNDIRVGSWLLLGSPEGPAEYLAALNERTARHFWAMETAGQFQTILLAGISGAA